MSSACSCLLHHGKWPCEAGHRAASAPWLLSAELSGGSRRHDGAPKRALHCPYRYGHDAGIWAGQVQTALPGPKSRLHQL